jgi:hypothetical protein
VLLLLGPGPDYGELDLIEVVEYRFRCPIESSNEDALDELQARISRKP